MRQRWPNLLKPRSSISLIKGLCAGLAFLFGAATSQAYENRITPKAASEKLQNTEKMTIHEKLGGQLDLNLPVVNESGQTIALSNYFKSGKPVILSLIYYTCPGLCNYHLNGLFEGLKNVDWTPGNQFEMVVLSFDPKEGSDVAAGKKTNYLQLYGRPEAAPGVHFLTASQETIAAVTSSVGFNYQWDEASKQWEHSSAAIFLSPTGSITRYLHGVMFEDRNIRLALTEAADGKIGTFVDQMIWYCFMFDPKLSKYTFYSYRLVQAGGVLIILFLMLLVIPQWWGGPKGQRSSHP